MSPVTEAITNNPKHAKDLELFFVHMGKTAHTAQQLFDLLSKASKEKKLAFVSHPQK